MPSSSSSSPSSVDPLLFPRFNLEDEIVFDNEINLNSNNNNNNGIPVAQVLEAMGTLLDQAEQGLDELAAQDDLLGKAIVRGCNDLATAVGHLADHLEHQSEDERRLLAQACWDDVQQQQQRQQQQQLLLLTTSNSSQQQNNQLQQENNQQLQQLTTDDLMTALSGASTLLRDVEVTLRSIEQDEADEIADVALTLARLFVASLQSFHSTVVQQEEDRLDQKRQSEASRFEILNDDSDEDNADGTKTNERSTSNSNDNKNSNNTKKKQRLDRLRVLWPPLGPAVASACQWGKEEALQKPLLAVALGMTLWPAAVLTAFVGAPLVVADTVVQHTYNTFQHGPIVVSMEKSAAQLFQAAKLSLLCTKLVGRQSWRVIHRQIQRNGGVAPMAQGLVEMAVDRALHPAETVAAVWEGVHWAFGMVHEQWQQLHHHERQDATPANDVDDVWQQ